MSMLVEKLENTLNNLETVDLEVTHNFENGIYTRSLFIPKGTLLVGKRHRDNTINILSKGSMIIIDGDSKVEVTAPYQFIGEKLSKKAGYALEDSIWINIHITNSTDLDEIEKEVIISEEEYMLIGSTKCLG